MRNFVQLDNLIVPLIVTSVQDVGENTVLIEVSGEEDFEGAFLRKFPDSDMAQKFVVQCQSTYLI